MLGREIFSLFESRDGWLWAGSQSGLGRWDGQSWKLFTLRDGLSDNSVRAMAEDSTGNLWIGTENGGLDCFDGQKFTVYQATNGLPGNDISCFYMDDDNVLWVGNFRSWPGTILKKEKTLNAFPPPTMVWPATALVISSVMLNQGIFGLVPTGASCASRGTPLPAPIPSFAEYMGSP